MIANVCLSASKITQCYEWILNGFYMLILRGRFTWDLNSVDCGLLDAAQKCKHIGHLRRRHVLSFPSVKKDSYFKHC